MEKDLKKDLTKEEQKIVGEALDIAKKKEKNAKKKSK